jgi:hypothetical protein
MRSFIHAAAIAAALTSLPFTPGFAKSDPSQTATASKPDANSTLSAGHKQATEQVRTPAGDSSDWPPYMTDRIKTQPTLRQWLDSLFQSDDRPH